MLLSIIIVSFNTQDLTIQALKSVEDSLASDKKLLLKTEVIVIDNNSSDNSVKLIGTWQKETQLATLLIKNSKNTGFAKANNQGISRAKGKYVFLLNSDTIVEKNSIFKLISSFEKNPVQEVTAHLVSSGNKIDRLGILAPQLVNSNGSVQPQGGSFPNLISIFFHMSMLDDLPIIGSWLPSTQHTGYRSNKAQFLKNELINMDWVGATAMMIRREVIDEIGLLDEAIFMYGEDVEYCLRANDHHWDIALLTSAQVIHFGSASSSPSRALTGEILGYKYVWAKHKPIWQMLILKIILMMGCILRIFIFGTIKFQSEKAQTYREILHKI